MIEREYDKVIINWKEGGGEKWRERGFKLNLRDDSLVI